MTRYVKSRFLPNPLRTAIENNNKSCTAVFLHAINMKSNLRYILALSNSNVPSPSGLFSGQAMRYENVIRDSYY